MHPTGPSECKLDLITEVVNIRNTPSDELLNTKKEWNYVSIPRTTITDSLGFG